MYVYLHTHTLPDYYNRCFFENNSSENNNNINMVNLYCK